MASLSQLQKKIQNTANRQSQVFLRTESLNTTGTSYSIDGVDTSQDYFEVQDVDLSGDNEFSSGYEIYVQGSTGNDSNYTVDTVNIGDFDGEGDTTDSRILVQESVDDSTADGTIYVDKDFSYVNLGRVMDVNFTAEPVASDADQDGRESAQTFDCTVQATMMQASETEMSLVPQFSMPSTEGYGFYRNGHTLYFSGQQGITASDVNNAVTDDPDPSIDGDLAFGDQMGELDDPRGILFEEVILKPTEEINLQGEASMIPIEFTGRIINDTFASIDADQTITISFK